MRHITLLVVLMVALGGQTQTYAAEQLPQSSFIEVGEFTSTPIGWIGFCGEYRPECNTVPSRPIDAVLTLQSWHELLQVNVSVNEQINPLTDIAHWGIAEQWNYPDDGYGDCEDYVLQKQRVLIRAGWPRSALLITAVRDGKGEGHAVLTVKTNRGEYILDNHTDEVKPWYRTGYHFVKRQSQWDQNIWLSLGGPATVAGGR